MRVGVKNLTLAAGIAGVFLLSGLPANVSAVEKSITKTQTKKAAAKKPAEKVVVVVQSGDTLSAIAAKHKTTWVRLFNANPGLQNPDVLNAGDKVRIPNADETLPDRYGQLATAAQPTAATPQSNVVTKQYSSAPINSSSYYVGNGMWCTDYVQSKRPDVPVYGNAGYNWISAARADGKSTGSAPRVGAVAVTNGHVAYVESVNGDGSYTVSEMGWNYQAGKYNKRTVQPGTFGQFIYK